MAFSTMSWLASGLSPRVRGNPDEVVARLGGRGSIPACAGEPRLGPPGLAVPAVYPRVCGGTNGSKGAKHPVEGLSPRVRGNPCFHLTWV